MNITQVRIKKAENSSSPRLKGFASITIDDSFAIHDIKIIEGDKGLFLAMPSRRNPDGTYKDIAHPINSETRNMIQDEVLKAFNEAE